MYAESLSFPNGKQTCEMTEGRRRGEDEEDEKWRGNGEENEGEISVHRGWGLGGSSMSGRKTIKNRTDIQSLLLLTSSCNIQQDLQYRKDQNADDGCQSRSRENGRNKKTKGN